MADYVVSVDDAHLERLAEIAERLRGAGLDVTNVMPRLGAIAGAADPEAVATLRAVAGVRAVEPSRPLGPA